MHNHHTLLLAGLAGLGLLAGCNKAPQTDAAATAEAAKAEADAAADNAATQAKEADLAQREAVVAARESDIAAAAAKGEKPRPAAKPVVASRPPASTTTSQPIANAPAVTPLMLTVPGGTQLSLSLTTPLSSKTAKVGDAVRARVTQDVRVNDRVAIAAGSTVAGQVTAVVSGSDKIGGVPMLGLRFDRLELAGGVDVPIDGMLTQKGKSDTGRDTAKIVGGAAAGAILGDQVKGGDKGKVLGGLLGGAIGAIAAQKTGTEVKLEEGTELSLALASAVEITRR
ncbi:MAG: glycine zipper 2TM domain-containing protein [Steroidobacteraceae bacterium]